MKQEPAEEQQWIQPKQWWAEEEQECGLAKAILHQDLFLPSTTMTTTTAPQWPTTIGYTTIATAPLLKQEPLCAVFVGSEPGIMMPSAASNYIANTAVGHSNINTFAGFEAQQQQLPIDAAFHSLPYSEVGPSGTEWMIAEHQQQQSNAAIGSMASSNEFGMPTHAYDNTPPHFHHQFLAHSQPQQSHYIPQFVSHPMQQTSFPELLDIADISQTSSTSGILAVIEQPTAPMLFEPLSVGSSYSSSGEWSSSGEEYSSPSQDEIFEEIQRECAEIEQRQSAPEEIVAAGTSEEQAADKQQMLKKASRTKSQRKAKTSGGATTTKAEKRQERKKALNRVAATRYREKKRLEREVVADEMDTLEARNRELKADIAAVQAEMNYLKGLAKEIEAARKKGGTGK